MTPAELAALLHEYVDHMSAANRACDRVESLLEVRGPEASATSTALLDEAQAHTRDAAMIERTLEAALTAGGPS